MGDDLTPHWPEGCAAGAERPALRQPPGSRARWRSTASASATPPRMVKVFWLDGQSRVYTLTSAQPTVQLYGSADDRRGMGEIARAYTVLGVEHILSGHRSPAVRRRAAVPGRLPAPADRDDHGVHAGAQPDARVQRVRLAHAALAAGRGDDRAVDRAGRERGAARARHAGAAPAGAGVVPVRARARPRLRRRAEGDRPAAEPPSARPARASTSAWRSASC